MPSLLHFWLILLLRLLTRAILIKLGSATWATVMFFQPFSETSLVKGMTTWQLTSFFLITSNFFKADIAVSLFVISGFWQILDELITHTLGLWSCLLSMIESKHTSSHETFKHSEGVLIHVHVDVVDVVDVNLRSHIFITESALENLDSWLVLTSSI